jgi:hypothetical protein
MCLIDDHPCLSPTAPSPSARNPRAVDNARCKIVSSHCTAVLRLRETVSHVSRTPPVLSISGYRSHVSNVSNKASQPSTWPASVDVHICSAHHHVRYLISSSSHFDARSCSPCLHVLKQVLSFEVRRHVAASCAIRLELCQLPCIEDTAFWSWQPYSGKLIDYEFVCRWIALWHSEAGNSRLVAIPLHPTCV